VCLDLHTLSKRGTLANFSKNVRNLCCH
jgi:hypothetical protein